MAFSKELIERFQVEHLAVYGEEIDTTRAELQLKELAELIRLTSPREEQENETAYSRGYRSQEVRERLQG